MKFVAHANLRLESPRFTFRLDISKGTLKTASVELSGVGGLDVGIEGGTSGLLTERIVAGRQRPGHRLWRKIHCWNWRPGPGRWALCEYQHQRRDHSGLGLANGDRRLYLSLICGRDVYGLRGRDGAAELVSDGREYLPQHFSRQAHQPGLLPFAGQVPITKSYDTAPAGCADKPAS
jgi:hypothetical protein